MSPPFGHSFAASNNAPPTSPDDAVKQALLAVVQVWLDRLQSMAVVTTFFVSIDSMLYSFSAASPNPSTLSEVNTLIMASLGGSIILHVCASILAYCASFVLIRYRLNDAVKEEDAAEHAPAMTSSGMDRKQLRTQPLSLDSTYVRRSPSWDAYIDLRSLVSVHQIDPLACCRNTRRMACKRDPEALPQDPNNAVTQLRSMVGMLSRVHTATVIMTVLGFILALLGTLAYFWTGLPRALGIFASACLGGCVFAGTVALL